MESRNTGDIDIFFSLLRSGMYGIPVPESELPEYIDWEAVLRLAKKHVVTGIIIESVQFLPERLRPADDISVRMNKFALGLFRTNIILDNAVARLTSFLRKHGIEGVVLKGQGVARYYRMPQMRQSGDIDFYVGREQYERVVNLCRDNLVDVGTECHETGRHYVFKMDGVSIELHRLASRLYSPFRNRLFQNWVEEQLEHSSDRRTLMFGNVEVLLPSFDFDAIFIFYHAWRHYIFGGIGLRQLCDWAMIFHSHAFSIDAERLKENISKFGLSNGWKLFACIAVKYLGVSPDIMPLYDEAFNKKSEKALVDILNGGNFGYYSEAYRRTQVYGSSGFHRGVRKVCNLSAHLFSNFALMPVEATFLFFNRLFYGAIDTIKCAINRSDK